jgi:hypothetical protein
MTESSPKTYTAQLRISPVLLFLLTSLARVNGQPPQVQAPDHAAIRQQLAGYADART